MKKNSWILLAYLGLIGIAGFILVLRLTTPYGVGVSPDSATYIGGARNLLAGRGFFFNGSPITHFPPLYPLFLSAVGLLDNNLLHAARFLSAILFAINLGLVALVVYLAAGRNFLITTFAVLFFASSEPVLELHLWAWSEPLFITFSLACILLLSLYVIKPIWSWLIASALCLGFALITRYIGGAFLPAALVLVFVGGAGQKLARRVRDSLIWLGLACAPLIILSIRNTLMIGTATDRSFAIHPMSLSYYVPRIFTYMVAFIIPITLPNWAQPTIFALVAVTLLALFIILFKRPLRDTHWRSMGLVVSVSCLLFSVCYFVLLFISISFLDAKTTLDWRLLSPGFVLLTVAAFSAVWTISQSLKKPLVWWCFLVLIALFISMKIPDSVQSVAAFRTTGLGYTSKDWRHSQTVAFVQSLGGDQKIYSDGADVIGFLTEKDVPYFPEKYDPYTKSVNPLYDKEIADMCADTRASKALVVYIYSIPLRAYLPTKIELESACQLPVLQSFADGMVYGVKDR